MIDRQRLPETAMTGTTVTRATAADLDALLPLFHGYLRFYDKPVDAAKTRDFLGARLRNDESVVFLARDAAGGEALGFVQLYPAFASLSQARSWILNDLFVAEPARGRGVSKALMEAARQLAVETDACELFLQTARDNVVAQSLYRSLGWVRDDHFLVYTLDVPAAT
jgi:GNAT superfamily N-acetyltransferase